MKRVVAAGLLCLTASLIGCRSEGITSGGQSKEVPEFPAAISRWHLPLGWELVPNYRMSQSEQPLVWTQNPQVFMGVPLAEFTNGESTKAIKLWIAWYQNSNDESVMVICYEYASAADVAQEMDRVRELGQADLAMLHLVGMRAGREDQVVEITMPYGLRDHDYWVNYFRKIAQ